MASSTSSFRAFRPAHAALLAIAAIALGTAAAPALADGDEPGPTTPVETTPTTPVETTPATTPPVPAEPTTPETEPAGPPQTPLLARTDGVPPALALTAVRRDLEDARRHGLRVTYRVSEPVTLRTDVLIYGEVADRELRMCALPAAGPGDSLAKSTVLHTPVGASVVRVPFNVPSRRTLKKFYKLTVKVRLIATDRSGAETTVTKTIALKRQ